MNERDEGRIPRKETFIWRKRPGDIIEVEGKTTHYLNPMGSRIWELINERNTVADIIRFLVEAESSLGEPEEGVRRRVKHYLDDLENKGLISYDTGVWSE
jgi:hypothetical protein